jgi:general secretion pathway protein A
MYTTYFGLKEPPFSLTPDPRYLYMSTRHREALAHLVYGMGEGGGFVQLTGEIGTGKTTLSRCLLEQLPSQVDVALILNPRLTSAELLAAVCDELRAEYPAGTTSVKLLVDALYRYLLTAHERGRRTVLVIDEAQNLDPDVLEQVRLLTNLETPTQKLLQIILIGQPELITLLERPDLRQLAQRITARYHLQPFSEAETRAYIRHRLEVAGRKGGLFSAEAVHAIHKVSGGVPRLINVICDRALLGAYAGEKKGVDASTVRRAAREVRGLMSRPRSLRRLGWVSAVALATAVVAASLLLTPRPLAHLGNALRSAPPAPATPPVMAVANTVAPAPPAPRLAELLGSPSVATDRASAFARLHARWRPDYAGNVEDLGCERIRREGLRCLSRTGTWNRLRRFDLPAVLELITPAGDRHYVALIALHAEQATLDLGGREVTLPLSEIDPVWDGGFLLLWRAGALRSAAALGPGVRGRDVGWLRRRLDEIEAGRAPGRGAPPAADDVYDEGLRARVLAFQRSRGLAPDGIAGEETLANLTTAPPVADVPLLSAARR